ncbi:MAG: AsmA family protein, partial [Mucinivorans sp.]
MKKTAKIILTIICSLIILVVMLPIVLSMLLQIGFVQKFAVDKTTEILSNLTGTTFSISRVEIGFFNKAYFEDVYVESPTGDTMIYVQKVDAAVNGINFFTGKIALGNVTLSDAKVYLYKDSTGMMNVQTVFDHFKPKVPNPNPPNFRMSCTQVNLVDACLKLDDFTSQEQPWGVNFKNMELQRINFQATNVEIFNYDVRLAITHLSLREKCGFKLQHASSTKCGVNVTGMRFENFRIETPQSILRMPHFNLLYDSWYDYNNFVNEVTLDAELSNSRVSIATINYFMKKKLPINTVVEIDARVVGIIPRLSGQIESAEVEGSHFSGDFVITGLPDITQTNFAFSLPNLTTSSNSIGRIVTQITGKPLSADLMAILERNNEIHLSGQFDGLLSDFTANCLLTTALGSATAALRVNPRHAGGVGFVGSIHTQDYALGKALDSKKLGGLSLDASVDALLNQQGDIELKTAATINSLQWNGYRYNQIEMNGKLGKSIFDGSLSSTDSNFNCTAHGLFDFSLSEPHYDFTMSLKNANLGQLNINKRDSISLLAAQATINLSVVNIENLNVWATIDSIHYINHIDTVETGAIYITSENTETKKLITLNSDFADIELRGRNSYANMFGYLTKMAATYIPSIPDATEIVTGTKTDVIKQAEAEQTFSDGYYILKVNVKQANNVAAIFVPGLEIARGSKIDFFFNPHLNKFNFDLHSDYILTNDFIIDSLDINSRNQGDSLSLFMTIDQMQVGKIYLPNLSALAGIKDNRIALSVRFEADDHSSGALISTLTDIYRTKEGTPQLDMQIFPGTITLNKERWRLSSDGVVIDTSGIVIKKFGLNSNSQNLSIDGKIGRAASDTLRLGIKNLNLSPLSVFVDDLGYS